MTPGATKLFDPSEVLAKAMELFWMQGYEATGMSQLVEHLDIGRQSLYNEFGDKRGLFLAALRAYADTAFEGHMAILDQPGSPLGNMRALCHHWLQMAEQETCEGCFLANTAAEFGSKDAEVQGIVMLALRRCEDAFCGVLQRAQDDGELDPEARPRDLARLFVSAGQGVALMSRLQGSNAIVASTVRAILGLLPSPPVAGE